MPANYRNHCASSNRCLECPIERLMSPKDRTDAAEITRAVLIDPENADLADASVTQLNAKVEKKTLALRGAYLAGTVIGAAALSVDGRCIQF